MVHGSLESIGRDKKRVEQGMKKKKEERSMAREGKKTLGRYLGRIRA